MLSDCFPWWSGWRLRSLDQGWHSALYDKRLVIRTPPSNDQHLYTGMCVYVILRGKDLKNGHSALDRIRAHAKWIIIEVKGIAKGKCILGRQCLARVSRLRLRKSRACFWKKTKSQNWRAACDPLNPFGQNCNEEQISATSLTETGHAWSAKRGIEL